MLNLVNDQATFIVDMIDIMQVEITGTLILLMIIFILYLIARPAQTNKIDEYELDTTRPSTGRRKQPRA